MWQLDQHLAMGNWPPLWLESRLDQAPLGWRVTLGGNDLAGRWWQIRLPWLGNVVPCDQYVRGNDLVVRYPLQSRERLEPVVYWRALAGPASEWGGVELILSMQTDSLDSDPSVFVRTWTSSQGVYFLDHAGKLVRLEATRRRLGTEESLPVLVLRTKFGTYIEMVYPGDFCSVRVAQVADRASIAWKLFAERLEKGVIRRTRVQGIFASSDVSPQTIVQAYDAFCQAPLPLTA
ncbi:MAG: hypothetical protein KatS3mg110_2867 [Pirellulaceae bacterium]|nr:MAG: hypothetical protein KatS3mg110_2867 [Pirellulaceae bacterium]